MINSNIKCIGFYLLITSIGYFPTLKRPTLVSSNSETLIENVWTNNIGADKIRDVILSGFFYCFPTFFNQYLANELLGTDVS